MFSKCASIQSRQLHFLVEAVLSLVCSEAVPVPAQLHAVPWAAVRPGADQTPVFSLQESKAVGGKKAAKAVA